MSRESFARVSAPRIIGVIDLKDGIAVHAVAGHRGMYRPIGDVFGGASDPATVAANLLANGATELYVADLDGLSGQMANRAAIQTVATLRVPMLLDAGLSPLDLPANVRRIAAIEATKPRQRTPFPVFGLDLRDGRPLNEVWGDDPMAIAGWSVAAGYSAIAVVDIAAVGTGAPTLLGLCRRLAAAFPAIELIAGGGVRDANDVEAFHAAGCDGVLVGSALHRGAMTPRSAP